MVMRISQKGELPRMRGDGGRKKVSASIGPRELTHVPHPTLDEKNGVELPDSESASPDGAINFLQ